MIKQIQKLLHNENFSAKVENEIQKYAYGKEASIWSQSDGEIAGTVFHYELDSELKFFEPREHGDDWCIPFKTTGRADVAALTCEGSPIQDQNENGACSGLIFVNLFYTDLSEDDLDDISNVCKISVKIETMKLDYLHPPVEPNFDNAPADYNN